MTPDKNMRAYAIGEMSRRTGVNIETIRYYERIGLMPKPGRTSGGNRQFDHAQLKRLTFVRRARGLGFSIEEIRGLLSMVDGRGVTCADIHTQTVRHLQDVRNKITTLQELETVLADMAAECSRGDIPDCPVIDRLFETGQARSPEANPARARP